MTFERGQDGAIANFMPDITDAARESNGFVLEIGPAKGTGSTLAIQEGLVGAREPLHISVDHQDYMEIKPDVPWWHLVMGDSRQIATYVDVARIARGRIAGLIFIDTDHNYEQMSRELPIWALAAEHGTTTWLFHDTWMHGECNHMNDAIKEFAAANGWTYEDWRTDAHGLGRMR